MTSKELGNQIDKHSVTDCFIITNDSILYSKNCFTRLTGLRYPSFDGFIVIGFTLAEHGFIVETKVHK